MSFVPVLLILIVLHGFCMVALCYCMRVVTTHCKQTSAWLWMFGPCRDGRSARLAELQRASKHPRSISLAGKDSIVNRCAWRFDENFLEEHTVALLSARCKQDTSHSHEWIGVLTWKFYAEPVYLRNHPIRKIFMVFNGWERSRQPSAGDENKIFHRGAAGKKKFSKMEKDTHRWSFTIPDASKSDSLNRLITVHLLGTCIRTLI